jgi:hypothetical protein
VADRNNAKKLLAWPLLGAVWVGILMLPGALRLRNFSYRRTVLYDASIAGIVNLREAVDACRQTGLQGWELVTFAQQLVAKKFATYSTLNLWDPPGRAFIFGTGYCTQYNLALRQLLCRLGFQVETVFVLRAHFFDNPDWSMGHTWLRITVDGETRDVCAGRPTNEAGKVHFVPLSTVHKGRGPAMFLTHIGLIHFMGFLEWKALLSRTESPSWTHVEQGIGERV